MEAASMGVPVIATDIRGCREVVEHGVNGFLVPVRDARALRDAILELGENEDLRTRLGEQSRKKAILSFDEAQVVERVITSYRRVAAEKGLTHLAARLQSPDTRVRLREAVADDAGVLARMHMEAISTGFLPKLGHRFMTRLYRAMISSSDAVVRVADADGPVGFVAGVTDTDAFYSAFYRQHGLGAALVAAPALLRPTLLRRAWETARYSRVGDGDGLPAAELLSMAVAPSHRRRGLGRELGGELLAELAERGCRGVKVVVGADNDAAAAAYRKMGFVDAGDMEVHPGERSLVLVWSPPQS